MSFRPKIPKSFKKELSANAKARSKFRATAVWKKLRIRLKKERKVDEVTNRTLIKGFSLHHCDLNPAHYQMIEDEERFACLNKRTHEFIHWLYPYYRDDKKVIERIIAILDKMVKLNA